MPEQAPAFSTVNAYLLSDFPASQQPSPGVAPPAGITVRSSVVVANSDGVVAMTGLADDTAYVFGDNTDGAGKWRYWWVRTPPPTVGGLAERKRALWAPPGVLDENYPRWDASGTANAGDMTSGTLYAFGGCVAPAGVAVTAVSLIGSSTVATSSTHLWACLLDVNRYVLAVSADDTSAAPVTAHTLKRLTLAAPYTAPVDTPVYVGVCQVFTGAASRFYGWPQSTQEQNIIGAQTGAPMLAVVSSGGLTTPASLGARAAVFGSTNVFYYCRLEG